MGRATVRIDRPAEVTSRTLPLTTKPIKSRLGDLAIFGGAPAFNDPLHVGRPNVGNRQLLLDRLNDILDRCWLTNNGPYVQRFEQRIAEIVGVKHCVAMCSGTMALEIAARGLGLSGEVILPAMTFVATAHAMQWQQITPVFADIDPDTWNIDASSVERLITPRTSGIVGVHLWGRPCNTDRLAEIAKRRNLKLLFDASHSFGCSHNGRMVGTFGDAEVFSFHATKFVSADEGGAVVTNNDELADKLKRMRNFGFAGRDLVNHLGTNGKMNEMSAAIGLTSLEQMDELIQINRRNHCLYHQTLEKVPGIRLLMFHENERANYQYIVVEVDETMMEIHRDDLVSILQAEKVLARRYFYPGCHKMEPYRSNEAYQCLELPITDRIVGRVLSLPTGMHVDEYHIRRICDIIRFVVAHGAEVSRRLRSTTPSDSPLSGPAAATTVSTVSSE